MTNIRLQMNYYSCAKEWVVIVLFDNAQGVSSSLNYYFKTARKAASRKMTTLENELGIKGTVNE